MANSTASAEPNDRAIRKGSTAELPSYPYFGKYFAIVVADGLRVASETPYINNAEIITIGTTGMKPNTAVPPGVRERASIPPTDHNTADGPGAGAGTE